ncbi:HET-domain-containing protein [Xylariaceae sp. FL1651]|nr:HET-domain-containing protein [Xylariaceae sp. FL1651]
MEAVGQTSNTIHHRDFQSTIASVRDAPACLPCAACKAILPDRRQLRQIENSNLETSYEVTDLYPAYPILAASAQAGCSLCGLIRQRLISIPPDIVRSIEHNHGSLVWVSSEQRQKQLATAWDRKMKIRITFDFVPYITVSPGEPQGLEESLSSQKGSQCGGAVTSMWVRCRPVAESIVAVDGTPWNGETLEFLVFDSPDLCSPRSQWKRRLPSPTTLSSENIEMIKLWIDDCTNGHSLCSSSPGAGSWIPSRLLQIDHAECDLEIRLVESSGDNLPLEITFAALSHVWGNWNALPPLRLLSSNYNQFQKGIKESELPKNFLNAARVCVQLNIRYIWIDSLCIIQDSLSDWQQQAVLMHLVYRHALITIVATSAASCHDGFLERSIDTSPAVKVAYTLPLACGETRTSDGYMIICDYADSQDSYRMFAVNGSKWNTRAWTMQERSLSTRMVHFCRNKIFFECRGCLRSEENEPTEEPDTANSILWPRDNAVSFTELYQYWQLFVGEYCSRKLTVKTDKLPAIQSVAEEMASVTGHKYIKFAGMWRPNLHNELLWYVSFGKAERPGGWRAPSWSWAALEGQISLWQRNFRSSQQFRPGTLLSLLAQYPFEVLDTDLDTPDPESKTLGFLRVKSLVKRFDCIKRYESSSKGRIFFSYDLVIGESWNGNGAEASWKVFAYGRLDFEELDPTLRVPGRFLYLHVNNDSRATGLILQAQTYDEAGSPISWRRIGIATLFFDQSESPILADTFNNWDTPQEVVII